MPQAPPSPDTPSPPNTPPNTPLDDLDAQLLDIIQTAFPIAPRPYAVLGERLGLTEAEAFARTSSLKERGIIRRLGANFQSKALGFCSTLCTAKVPKDKLDAFVQRVNAYPEVTHNYIREHEYNVWFTLIASSLDKTCAILAEITANTDISILNLPATRLYKIRVDFRMQQEPEA